MSKSKQKSTLSKSLGLAALAMANREGLSGNVMKKQMYFLGRHARGRVLLLDFMVEEKTVNYT